METNGERRRHDTATRGKKKKRVRDEKVKKRKNEGIREENIETIIKRKKFFGKLTCWSTHLLREEHGNIMCSGATY